MGNANTKHEFINPPATPVPTNLLDPRSPRMNRTPIQELTDKTPSTNENSQQPVATILDPRSPSINRTPIPELTISPTITENTPLVNATTQPVQSEPLLEEIDLSSSFKRKLTFTPAKESPTQTLTMGLDKENVPNESDWLVPKYHRRLRHKRQSVSPTTAKSTHQARSPLSVQRFSSPVTQNSPTMKLRNL